MPWHAKLVKLSLRCLLVLAAALTAFVVCEISLRGLVRYGNSRLLSAYRDRDNEAHPPSNTRPLSPANTGRLFEYDPVLGWRGRQNVRFTYSGLEFGTVVENNDQGFRDSAWEKNKKGEKRKRLVILGDSFAWGFGVSKEQRFGEVLKDLLHSRSVDVEVLNFALPGYATDQAFLVLDRIAANYEPDLVILAFYENDVDDNTRTIASGDYPKPRFLIASDGGLILTNVPVPQKSLEVPQEESNARLGLWSKNSLGFRFRKLVSIRLASDVIRSSRRLYEAGLTLGMMKYFYGTESSRDVTVALVRATEHRVEEIGAEFLVLRIPPAHEVERELPLAIHTGTLLTEKFGKSVVLDLVDWLRARRASEAMFFNEEGRHLTAAGNREVARAMLQHLSTSGSGLLSERE